VLITQTVMDLVAGSGLAFQEVGDYELRVAGAFEQIKLAEPVRELDEVLLVGRILHRTTL
jgi:hypothetical protein